PKETSSSTISRDRSVGIFSANGSIMVIDTSTSTLGCRRSPCCDHSVIYVSQNGSQSKGKRHSDALRKVAIGTEGKLGLHLWRSGATGGKPLEVAAPPFHRDRCPAWRSEIGEVEKRPSPFQHGLGDEHTKAKTAAAVVGGIAPPSTGEIGLAD